MAESPPEKSIDNNQPMDQTTNNDQLPVQTSLDSSEKPRRKLEEPTIIINDPIPEITRKSSESFPMSIDDDNSSFKNDDVNSGPFHLVVDPAISSSKPLENTQCLASKVDGPYLTSKEFDYTMKIMDDKINALYKLCRYIGDQQEQTVKSLKQLVKHDELSDQFWNVGYLIYLLSIFILILIIKMIFI